LAIIIQIKTLSGELGGHHVASHLAFFRHERSSRRAKGVKKTGTRKSKAVTSTEDSCRSPMVLFVEGTNAPHRGSTGGQKLNKMKDTKGGGKGDKSLFTINNLTTMPWCHLKGRTHNAYFVGAEASDELSGGFSSCHAYGARAMTVRRAADYRLIGA